MTIGNQTERAVNPAHDPGHGRLTRARVSDEDQMPADGGVLQARGFAHLRDADELDLLVDLALGIFQTDEPLEVVEGFTYDPGICGTRRLGCAGASTGRVPTARC